jgi:hypothetical protein
MKIKLLVLAVILTAVCVFSAVTYYIMSVRPYDFSPLLVRFGFTSEAEYEFTPLDGGSPRFDGFELAMESDELAFYIDPLTAGFMILDRRNDIRWYSSPEFHQYDPIANNVEKNNMASQLIIRYFDEFRRENIWTSFDKSVSRDQFDIKRTADGIRVIYTFGRLELGVDLLPEFISEERFHERILANLDQQTSLYVRTRYVASRTMPGFFELLPMVRSSEIHTARMLEAFEQAEYTEEDLEEDNRIAGVEMSIERDYIVIPVEYSLFGADLRVNIPLDMVQESENLQLSYIEVLNFFGAGGVEDEGYLFVPSGSGGLINFNNGKSNQSAYVQNVYGTDPLFFRQELQNTHGISLPVFGISKQGKGMIALVESGDAMASVNADVSGRRNSYNYVFPSFTLRETDTMFMSGVTGTESDLRVIQDTCFNGDISILYSFLAGEESGYSDMAAVIRERFIRGGAFQRLEETSALPMYLTVLGAVESKKRLIGVPYNSYEVMTTHRQAETIIQEVYAQTGAELNVRYLGWFNNGVNHTVASNISLIRPLGSRRSFNSFNDMLRETGGKLFPDVQFQTTAYSGNLRYSKTREAGRWMDGFTALDAVKSRVILRKTGALDGSVSYINSPRSVPNHVDRFIGAYDRFGLETLALRDLGTYIASDHRNNHTIDRETAKLAAQEQIRKLGGSYPELMLRGANYYALPYAAHVIDVPLGADMYYIIDEEVPFYQMVIHGFIDYSGSPVNTDDAFDERTTLLRMLEYGASPQYILTYQESSLLKRTIAGQYYSTRYSDWMDTINRQYAVLNEVNGQLRTQTIRAHVKHADGVFETVYSNGVSVFVNYTCADVTIGDIRVASNDFAVRMKQ